MKRAITPAQFANAVLYALSYREGGQPTFLACRYALREAGIFDYADDWVTPLCAMLDNSPTTAEAWARRILANALADVARKMEEAVIPSHKLTSETGKGTTNDQPHH